jgi:hypothetical protein
MVMANKEHTTVLKRFCLEKECNPKMIKAPASVIRIGKMGALNTSKTKTYIGLEELVSANFA